MGRLKFTPNNFLKLLGISVKQSLTSFTILILSHTFESKSTIIESCTVLINLTFLPGAELLRSQGFNVVGLINES